nr:MAG TPA: hypothetical protein [Caudoviricetes sp.]
MGDLQKILFTVLLLVGMFAAVGFVAISAAHYADFPAWVRASYSAIMLGGLCGFLKYIGREVPEK